MHSFWSLFKHFQAFSWCCRSLFCIPLHFHPRRRCEKPAEGHHQGLLNILKVDNILKKNTIRVFWTFWRGTPYGSFEPSEEEHHMGILNLLKKNTIWVFSTILKRITIRVFWEFLQHKGLLNILKKNTIRVFLKFWRRTPSGPFRHSEGGKQHLRILTNNTRPVWRRPTLQERTWDILVSFRLVASERENNIWELRWTQSDQHNLQENLERRLYPDLSNKEIRILE